jgi:hypothetical protein
VTLTTDLLTILIPALTGIALHVAARFFTETHKISADLHLLAQRRMRQIELSLLAEMENDVQRSLEPIKVDSPLGVDFPARRRSREARQLTDNHWAIAADHAHLSQDYASLSRWEDRGQLICAIGTFMNLLLVPVLLVLAIAKPAPILVGTSYAWIAIVALVSPVIAAAYCYLAGYPSKRSLHEAIHHHPIHASRGNNEGV